jgi:hypothetical protein
MFSTPTMKYLKYMSIFLLFGYVNCSCFTMPPKIVPVSKWTLTVPNTNSPNYNHETHHCPKGYQLDSEYSHIVYEPKILLLGSSNIISLSIYGYAVCCEPEIIKISEISLLDNFNNSYY